MPILLIILFLWYIYSPSGIGQVRTSDLDVLAKRVGVESVFWKKIPIRIPKNESSNALSFDLASLLPHQRTHETKLMEWILMPLMLQFFYSEAS